MKLKLAQRMAIGYYKTKFGLLSIFSKRKAAEAVFDLFCRPYSGKPKRKAPSIFDKAEVLQLDFADHKMIGWRWKPELPNGKKILIVHGFDSCSYRFDRYIDPLTMAGFEVVAFDAIGHGLSSGNRINALVYSKSVIKIDELFGRFYGIMAHSLGGLATSIAFEQLPDQQSRKLVLIAPTTETSTAIDNFFHFIRINKKIKDAFTKVIVDVGKQPISYYSVKRVVQNLHNPVLWIHDEDDKICPYSDTIPVQELQLPNVEFFITNGLGHSGIYRHEKVFRKIMEFFG